MFWMSWKAASISSSIFLFFSLAVSRSSETAAQCGGGTTVEARKGFFKKGNVSGGLRTLLLIRIRDPGSGIQDPEQFFSGSRNSDPGSKTHNFESFVAFSRTKVL
jgi:hypothetical protein